MSRTIAFIPARGGSERIPSKNLALVGDKSLVERAMDVAIAANLDRVVVSTDDARLGEYVSHYSGFRCEVHQRCPEHAGPHAQIEEAMLHWLAIADVADEDVVALLQPTSPFRTRATVRRCVELVLGGCDSALTVTQYTQNTGRMRGLYDERSGTDIAMRTIWDMPIEVRPRSQDARPKALENGCVWAFTIGHLRRTENRMGGREASVPVPWLEAFEIDTPMDLAIARALATLPASIIGCDACLTEDGELMEDQ